MPNGAPVRSIRAKSFHDQAGEVRMGAHRKQWLSMLKGHPSEEARRLLEAAIQADPTSGQIYVSWVLGEFRAGVISLPENAPAVRDLLTRWEEVKGADTFTGDRDINRYSYYGLRRLVERPPLRQSQRQREKQTKQQGVETVYEAGRYRIVKVITPAAAMALARGTRWCTHRLMNAEEYLEYGPLYMVFRDGVRFAQIHLWAGEMKDERDARIAPDPELAGILERSVQPAILAEFVGLSLILGRPLLTPEQERDLLRCWSAGYNPDDLYQNLIIESASRYLEKYCAADPGRRGWFREMVRETLAEGRLEVACQLHHANILGMSKISRSLRCAIQRRIAAQDFHSLARLLSHFRGRNLLWTNLNDLTDHMIDYLWKLFRLDPATARTIASSPQPGEDDTPSGPHQAFAAFYEELRWVRKNNRKLKRGETMWRHWEYPPFSV
jgi:hypothetical protein